MSKQIVQYIFSSIFINVIFFFKTQSEPSSTTIRTETTTTTDGSRPTTRSVLGSPSLVRKVMNESRTRERSQSPKEREIKFDIGNRSPKSTREVKFETEPLIDTSPNTTTTRTYNYSKTTKRNTPSLKTEIVEMDTSDLPPEFKDIPISNDLLPQAGTKVTTTVCILFIIFSKLWKFMDFFFSFHIRSKPIHTISQTIQNCQLIKISHTKMSLIMSLSHRILIIQIVLLQRKQ